MINDKKCFGIVGWRIGFVIIFGRKPIEASSMVFCVLGVPFEDGYPKRDEVKEYPTCGDGE